MDVDECLLNDKTVSECYEKYFQSIYKYCRVRLGEFSQHAEDCVQDAFLVFYNKLRDGETVEQPRAFLYRTADNFVKRTVESCRRRQSRTVDIEEAAEKIAAPPESVPDDFDYDECARILIERLTAEERILYDLKYIQRKSLKEISETLNITPTATAKRTSRLRSRIKGLIKTYDII